MAPPPTVTHNYLFTNNALLIGALIVIWLVVAIFAWWLILSDYMRSTRHKKGG